MLVQTLLRSGSDSVALPRQPRGRKGKQLIHRQPIRSTAVSKLHNILKTFLENRVSHDFAPLEAKVSVLSTFKAGEATPT